MNSQLKIFALLFIALSFMGCGPARELTESQRDAVVVHVRDSVFLRDTVVMAHIPTESEANTLPDTDTSFLQTSIAESRAFVSDGKLHHTLRNRSEALMPVMVQYRDRARVETPHGLREVARTVEVEKDLNWWQRFLITIGSATLLAVVAWVVWRLKRLIL